MGEKYVRNRSPRKVEIRELANATAVRPEAGTALKGT